MKSRTEVTGWYNDEQGARLVELALAAPPDLPVVELGTAWGKSISYVLDGTDRDVVCVDFWGDGKDYSDAELYIGAYDYFITLLEEEDWTGRVEIIRAPTSQALLTWDRPIGLLHIDAGHDYADVSADYLGFSPFIPSGGGIALDDYWHDGPKRVVEELLRPDPNWYDHQLHFVQWSARRV